MSASAASSDPSVAQDAVLVKSEEMPEGTPLVRGPDFNDAVTLDSLLGSFKGIGFQATNLGLAIDRINEMLKWRLSDEPVKEDEDDDFKDPAVRAGVKATVFLGFTSNMISCGIREVIRFIFQHKMIDVAVTTGGGIEEDIMKCLAPHYHGDFALDGRALRKKGINRIGNLLVPNKNYCLFEDFFSPLLNRMHDEQERDGIVWTPSKLIHRLGKEINHPDSFMYWAYKHNIPVFSPAITDGSIGDMIFFHSYKRPGFILDIAGDIRGMNELAMTAKKSGALILGGGLVKHHIMNANLMRNGADWTVYLNTASDFDGSDSGASPGEALSWGKARIDSSPVKVYGECSLLFPLIAAQTFAKHTRLDLAEHMPKGPSPLFPIAPSADDAGAGAGAGAAPAPAAAAEKDKDAK